jgi:AraC-like DNA-binding protein
LNETDTYREFVPPPSARGAIACWWIRRGTGRPVRVIPDGCVDLVWRAGEGAVIAGPDTSAWLSSTRESAVLVGARFLPGAGGAAFGVPLTELRDHRVPVGELGLDPRQLLHGELDPADAPRHIANAALHLIASQPPDQAVQAAVVGLLDPTQRVNDLAESIGLSQRQLHRRFLAAVGYGPKTLHRVLRLRRFLTAPRADLSRAAFEAGYADQAHLARECKALTGLSPNELRRVA